jgi:hypothetical protein
LPFPFPFPCSVYASSSCISGGKDWNSSYSGIELELRNDSCLGPVDTGIDPSWDALLMLAVALDGPDLLFDERVVFVSVLGWRALFARPLAED